MQDAIRRSADDQHVALPSPTYIAAAIKNANPSAPHPENRGIASAMTSAESWNDADINFALLLDLQQSSKTFRIRHVVILGYAMHHPPLPHEAAR
ncbi:hypothetical protein [Paraburkholderia sp. BL10I2N1]|uniref:hypothetical protein n=1 Tax=Paraburkholderia sp. BL10I2N1 TaxID=1938796 RepID=UPI00105CD2F7|nr:hypothetical protein [Paraburkholderia sp. BL10I2N1]